MERRTKMTRSNRRSPRRTLASLALGGLGGVSVIGNALALAWAPVEMAVPAVLLAMGVGALALLAAVLIWRGDDRARWALLVWGIATVLGHWLIVSPALRSVAWPGYLFVAIVVGIGFRALGVSPAEPTSSAGSVEG
jgi:hypothetical protein